mgnify:CR=1 FL=1
MKTVKIPMNATRTVRLSKVLKAKNKDIAFILEEGLKNLSKKENSFSRKV